MPLYNSAQVTNGTQRTLQATLRRPNLESALIHRLTRSMQQTTTYNSSQNYWRGLVTPYYNNVLRHLCSDEMVLLTPSREFFQAVLKCNIPDAEALRRELQKAGWSHHLRKQSLTIQELFKPANKVHTHNSKSLC